MSTATGIAGLFELIETVVPVYINLQFARENILQFSAKTVAQYKSAICT